MKREILKTTVQEILNEQTKLEIEFVKNQLNKYQQLILLHDEMEPLKIFKKSYISWIHRKKELEREYKKFQKELEELYFKNNNL